ncbi:MAG: class I SAM-dependent methyltransferase [bacterium]
MGKFVDQYKEIYLSGLAQQANNFWVKHRNKMILGAIKKSSTQDKSSAKILELGAGSGNICGFLHDHGYQVDASDLFASALNYLSSKAQKSFIFDLINDETPIELKGQYDYVILGDVIEHLDQPTLALVKAREFLSEKGRLIVTVPAMMSLWSRYDVISFHRKRYNKENLRTELGCAGYRVETMKYFVFIPALIIYFTRKIIADRELAIGKSAIINGIMSCIMSIEHKLGQCIDLPFGSSIIAVARK